MSLTDQSSNILNYLKCVLCIGVVFIHARIFPDLSVIGVDNCEDYNVYYAINQYFREDFLNHTCVPLFFVISGYLFFLNIPETFSIELFKTKWKKRIKSLLIPYLICNGIVLLMIISLSLIKGEEIQPNSLLTAFWSYKEGFPVVMPSWYLRDLMVVCMLSPVIWLLLKYTHYLLPLFLCFCWFMGVWMEIPGFGIRSFLFFTIGSYIGIKKYDFIEMVYPRKYWLLWFIILATIYGLYIYYNAEFLHKLSVLASFPVWVCIARFISSLIHVKCSSTFVAGTFFVFLYHFSIAHRASVMFTKLFGISEPSVILSYISGALFTTAIILTIFYLGRRFLPEFFMMTVGGR